MGNEYIKIEKCVQGILKAITSKDKHKRNITIVKWKQSKTKG